MISEEYEVNIGDTYYDMGEHEKGDLLFSKSHSTESQSCERVPAPGPGLSSIEPRGGSQGPIRKNVESPPKTGVIKA